jgi:cyclohexanone monooxygenase
MLRYLEHVASKYELYSHIEFETNVLSAIYDEKCSRWTLRADGGKEFAARFFISAMGPLSAIYVPDFEGVADFQGELYVPARWPKTGVDYQGKRIGIIGTGATAVQMVPIMAEDARELYVFQRTPPYVIEAQNKKLTDSDRRAMKDSYEETWQRVKTHSYGQPFSSPKRRAVDTAPELQQVIYEEGWQKGGFRFLFETFDDVNSEVEGNASAGEFVREKIRKTVRNPEVAERLTPRTYPLGAKRVPAGHHYYEAYNRPNVKLVDISEHGIERFLPAGVRVAGQDIELDIVVFATGFDAHTGALTSVDVRGRDGVTISEWWKSGPRTFLGMCSYGFPNMFAIAGPLSASANNPPVAEAQVNLISDIIAEIVSNNFENVEITSDAEEYWVSTSDRLTASTLLPLGEEFRSWMVGANIPGKAHFVQSYVGGMNEFLAICESVRKEFRSARKEGTDRWFNVRGS